MKKNMSLDKRSSKIVRTYTYNNTIPEVANYNLKISEYITLNENHAKFFIFIEKTSEIIKIDCIS